MMQNSNNYNHNVYLKKLEGLYQKNDFNFKFQYNEELKKVYIPSKNNEIFRNCNLQIITSWKEINNEIRNQEKNYLCAKKTKETKIEFEYEKKSNNGLNTINGYLTLVNFLTLALKYVSISGLWASYFQIIYNNDLNTLESRKNYFSGKFSSKSEENSETFYYNLQHFIIYEKIISIKKNNMKTHEKSYISTIYCLVKNFSLQLFTFITNYF